MFVLSNKSDNVIILSEPLEPNVPSKPVPEAARDTAFAKI
jgi:hypothetical protein